MKQLKKSDTLRFIAGLLAVLVAVVLVIVTSNAKLTFDVSAQKPTVPGEELAGFVSALDTPAAVYVVGGFAAQDLYTRTLLENIDAKSDALTVQEIAADGANALQIAAVMPGYTPTSGDLIFMSEKRYLRLSNQDMYSAQIDPYYYYYYQQTVYSSYEFVAQDRILSALSYVTRDDLPVVGVVTAHGESGFDYGLAGMGKDIGCEFVYVSLAQIPEDVNLLVISEPMQDYSAEECKALRAWLEQGKDLLLVTNYQMNCPNLYALLAEYGMSQEAGIVLDNDAGHYASADYKYVLRPDLADGTLLAERKEAGDIVICMLASALDIAETLPEGVSVEPLLITSEQGYCKRDTEKLTTLDMEEGDDTGSFNVALHASRGEGDIFWFSAGKFLSESNNVNSAGGITRLLGTLLASSTAPAEPAATVAGVDLMAKSVVYNTNMCLLLLAAPVVIFLILGIVMGLKNRRGGKKK